MSTTHRQQGPIYTVNVDSAATTKT